MLDLPVVMATVPTVIGPSLPPTSSRDSGSLEPGRALSDVIGPALPPGYTVAPSSGSEDSDSDSSASSGSDRDKKSNRKTVAGPSLPKKFKKTDEANPPSSVRGAIGPAMPPGYKITPQSSSDDELDTGFGPRPPVPGREKTAIEEFEDRARLMKHRLLHGDEEDSAPKRETWMMELPSAGLKKNIGLVARKLGSGSSVKGQDRSGWTDTPADTARKLREAAEGRGVKRPPEEEEEVPVLSERDRMMAEQVHKHNESKREKSLLEMHQKQIQKKKKKEDKKRKKEKKKKDKKNKKDKKTEDKPERRPFNREDDLQVNKFDAAQRKSLIRQSQQLNTKFGSGKQQFL